LKKIPGVDDFWYYAKLEVSKLQSDFASANGFLLKISDPVSLNNQCSSIGLENGLLNCYY